jgi:hypothetical protein
MENLVKAYTEKIENQNEDYWRWILRLTIRGRLDDAISLLKLTKRYDSYEIFHVIVVSGIYIYIYTLYAYRNRMNLLDET